MRCFLYLKINYDKKFLAFIKGFGERFCKA